jgi:hypothetical protein
VRAVEIIHLDHIPLSLNIWMGINARRPPYSLSLKA